MPTYRLNIQSEDLLTLVESGRWIEIMIPIEVGNKYMVGQLIWDLRSIWRYCQIAEE